MDNLKKILLAIAGIIIFIGFMFFFIYIFIFLVIAGLIYYIYRRFFKKKPKVKTHNKTISPIIIDMEEDEKEL